MSLQAYLDTVKARTGKTPDDFRQLAEERGPVDGGKVAKGVKAGDVVAWLKDNFDLGRGHAMAIRALFSNIKQMLAK